jgi:hypothetical protein
MLFIQTIPKIKQPRLASRHTPFCPLPPIILSYLIYARIMQNEAITQVGVALSTKDTRQSGFSRAGAHNPIHTANIRQ